MYKALDIAKYVVNKCTVEEHPVSNLQLQKILYYIQKDFLYRFNEPAFSEAIEAWQFGPVVPNVYYHFCGSGAMPIDITYEDVHIENDEHRKCIDSIVENKRTMDPWKLVNDTHKKNGAWDKIYKNGSGNHNVISLGLIKEVG